jgi:thiosulfate dehydrogenase
MTRFTPILLAVCSLAGLGMISLRADHAYARQIVERWKAPEPSTIPDGPLGESIRLGLHIFDSTRKYAPLNVGNTLSCSNCHLQSGTQVWAAPMVGLPGIFPMYRDREKRVVTLEDRIQECFLRSENGRPLTYDGPEMAGLLSYIQWLSHNQVTGKPFSGRGFIALPKLKANPAAGGQIYAEQCSRCHGADSAGVTSIGPAVWGIGAYSTGAGMDQAGELAAFVKQNMPFDRPGSLTSQQAYDVAAYVESKPHPQFKGR